MRVATWNLERGASARKRAAQADALAELSANVVILTEPGPDFMKAGMVSSPPERPNGGRPEPWVIVTGASLEPVSLAIPFERMAAAATARVGDERLLVYGSVLPWNSFTTHAPEIAVPGETAHEAFARVLAAQVADIRALRRDHPEHPLIWAGDFNQSLSGPVGGTSTRPKRELLSAALADLDLVAWNADQANGTELSHAIDLICGPRNLRIREQGRIAPMRGGVRMSDHPGFWVDL